MKIYFYKVGSGLGGDFELIEEESEWKEIKTKYFRVSGNTDDVCGIVGDKYLYLSQINSVFKWDDYVFFSFRKLRRRELNELM